MPSFPLMLSAFASAVTFLAGFALLLPLLLLWERRRPPPDREMRPLRLRVLGPDGSEQRIEVARSVDELMEVTRRQQFSGERDVVVRLHPRAECPADLPSVG